MKVLITGIAGFVGSHFAEFFIGEKGIEIYGIEQHNASLANIIHIKDRIKLYDECDIKDIVFLESVMDKIKPNFIIHLAAQSSPVLSGEAPIETLQTNIIGTVNLFEAIRNLRLKPIVILAGSCDEYGFVRKDEIPIKETQPLRPLNAYAVSKVTQDLLGYQYYKSYGMNIIRTRPFHHDGPRRQEHFVCSSFAKQIALIEKGMQKAVIYVGNTEAVRDFTDVRDMVMAYSLLMKKGAAGEVYNICSGKGYSIKQVLDILLSMSRARVKVKKDPKRMRPNDVPVFIGDCTKLKRLTGWRPRIHFQQTLKDLLNYWRDNIR